MWAVSLFLHPAQRQKAITAFMIYFPSCPVPCSHLSSSCARPRRSRSRRRRRAWWAWSRCSARSWSTWSSCPTCCSGSCAAGTSCSRSACCWTFWRLSEITTRLSPLTSHSCARRCGCCSHWGWGCPTARRRWWCWIWYDVNKYANDKDR